MTFLFGRGWSSSSTRGFAWTCIFLHLFSSHFCTTILCMAFDAFCFCYQVRLSDRQDGRVWSLKGGPKISQTMIESVLLTTIQTAFLGFPGVEVWSDELIEQVPRQLRVSPPSKMARPLESTQTCALLGRNIKLTAEPPQSRMCPSFLVSIASRKLLPSCIHISAEKTFHRQLYRHQDYQDTSCHHLLISQAPSQTVASS